jgi:hypothetical protein
VPRGPESQPAPVTSPAAAVPAPSAAAPPFRSAAEDPKDGPCIKTNHGCIALNPDVDEGTIDVTICVPSYTRSVRPATSYTNGVKKKLMREAGIDAARIGDYELDHIVPLALGGHPRKLSNSHAATLGRRARREGEGRAGGAPEVTRVPGEARPHRCAGLHCAGLGSVRGAVPETMSGLSIVVAGACYLSIYQTCTSGVLATRRGGNSVVTLRTSTEVDTRDRQE